jgi:hypothetical protein
VQARADGAFWNAEYTADLPATELVEGRERERHTEFLRQSIDDGVNHCLLVGSEYPN